MFLRIRVMMALLLAAGCSLSRRDLPFPDLPVLKLENYQPLIREQVEQAYAEARARPRDAEANGKLGMVLDAYQQYQVAAICYQRARYLDPEAFSWAYHLGTVQAALGQHQQAAATLRDARRLDSKYLPARLKLAESLLAAGDLRASGGVYEGILRERPGSPFPYYGRGRVKEAQGDLEGAAVDYRRACELFPRFAAAQYALSQVSRRLGETAQAQEYLAEYQKAPLAQPPLDDPLREAIGQLNLGAQQHLARAVSLEAAGQLSEAAAEQEKALAIDPQLVQAHVNLIILYARLGQTDKAEKHYHAALELNPGLAESHYNFGVLLFEQHKYKEAGEAFRKAVEINPYYAEAQNNLAFALEREGRVDEALRHYRAAVENKPNYRLAHFHLGRLLLAHGNGAEAIGHFLATLTADDEQTPGFMYGTAAAYARLGDRRKALEYAREARRRASSRGQAQLVASIDKDLQKLEQR